jgi:hypothetical protein
MDERESNFLQYDVLTVDGYELSYDEQLTWTRRRDLPVRYGMREEVAEQRI